MIMMMIMMMMMTKMMVMPIRTLTRQAGSLGIIWRALLKREQSSAPLDVKTTLTSEWKIFENILKDNLSALWLLKRFLKKEPFRTLVVPPPDSNSHTGPSRSWSCTRSSCSRSSWCSKCFRPAKDLRNALRWLSRRDSLLCRSRWWHLWCRRCFQRLVEGLVKEIEPGGWPQLQDGLPSRMLVSEPFWFSKYPFCLLWRWTLSPRTVTGSQSKDKTNYVWATRWISYHRIEQILVSPTTFT